MSSQILVETPNCHRSASIAWPLLMMVTATMLWGLTNVVQKLSVAFSVESPSAAQFAAFAPGLVFLGVFGTGLSFALSAHAQRGLSICAAAFVMNLEALFTAIAGHAVMGEILGAAALLGGAMILGGRLLVQVRR